MNDLKYFLSQVEHLFAEECFIAEPKELYAPIDYTLSLGGKRIRPTLLMVANAMFGGREEDVRGAALGIETFHNFTLVHDDLMDRSPLRRGKPTVYLRWDQNTAILSGDTMFALAWRYFLRQPSPCLYQVLNCFNETAIAVCEGQQYDMNFERTNEVDIDGYLMMIGKKTAALLAGALEIGALYAGAPADEVERLRLFGMHLGMAFQLQDDLLDCYGDTEVFGKKNYQDIRDNKKTYLPLRAALLGTPQQRQELNDIFADADIDLDEKVQRVVAIYDAVGLRQDVEQAIAAEFEKARQALDAIGVAEERKQPLRELLEMLFGRKK